MTKNNIKKSLLTNLKKLSKLVADETTTEKEYLSEYIEQVNENDFDNGLILYLEDETELLKITILNQIKEYQLSMTMQSKPD